MRSWTRVRLGAVPASLQQKNKGVLIHDWEYLLPEVQLLPIYDVFFLEAKKKVKMAYPGKPLSLELMRYFWGLLIRDVNDFVDMANIRARLEEVCFQQ